MITIEELQTKKYFSDEDTKLLEDATEKQNKKNEEILNEYDYEYTKNKSGPQIKIEPKKISPDELEAEKKPEKSPLPSTFYVNAVDFVVSYLSKAFATETTQTAKRIWLNDWWRYSAVVSRVNGLWMSWEKAYKGNQLDTWYLHNAEPMMRYLMDKEIGLMNHYIAIDSSNLVMVRKGEFLPTVDPPANWFQNVAQEMASVGKIELEKYLRSQGKL